MDSSFVSRSLKDLPEIAHSLFQLFKNERIIAIYGDLGVGKTELVKWLCAEMGVTEQPLSPTYSLVNEYVSQKSGNIIYHMDLYRLNDISEFFDIGYEDYFYGNGICFIEWPNIIETLLPLNFVEVRIVRPFPDNELRKIHVKKH